MRGITQKSLTTDRHRQATACAAPQSVWLAGFLARGVMARREAHNLAYAGSTPAPAISLSPRSLLADAGASVPASVFPCWAKAWPITDAPVAAARKNVVATGLSSRTRKAWAVASRAAWAFLFVEKCNGRRQPRGGALGFLCGHHAGQNAQRQTLHHTPKNQGVWCDCAMPRSLGRWRPILAMGALGSFAGECNVAPRLHRNIPGPRKTAPHFRRLISQLIGGRFPLRPQSPPAGVAALAFARGYKVQLV